MTDLLFRDSNNSISNWLGPDIVYFLAVDLDLVETGNLVGPDGQRFDRVRSRICQVCGKGSAIQRKLHKCANRTFDTFQDHYIVRDGAVRNEINWNAVNVDRSRERNEPRGSGEAGIFCFKSGLFLVGELVSFLSILVDSSANIRLWLTSTTHEFNFIDTVPVRRFCDVQFATGRVFVVRFQVLELPFSFKRRILADRSFFQSRWDCCWFNSYRYPAESLHCARGAAKVDWREAIRKRDILNISNKYLWMTQRAGDSILLYGERLYSSHDRTAG